VTTDNLADDLSLRLEVLTVSYNEFIETTKITLNKLSNNLINESDAEKVICTEFCLRMKEIIEQLVENQNAEDAQGE